MSCICRNEYDCLCDDTYYLDEDDEPQFDWQVFYRKVTGDYQAAQLRLDKAIFAIEACEPRGTAYQPFWWVPLSPLPAGLNVRIESDWRNADNLWGGDIKRTFTPETVWVELGDRSWIVTTAMWQYVHLPDGSPARKLTAVLASKPPDFGWWMPSLKESG